MGLFNRKNKNVEVNNENVAASNEVPAEIIAVISAAVACVLGAGAKIVGIRRSSRSNAGKLAWRNAGAVDNTRSF